MARQMPISPSSSSLGSKISRAYYLPGIYQLWGDAPVTYLVAVLGGEGYALEVVVIYGYQTEHPTYKVQLWDGGLIRLYPADLSREEEAYWMQQARLEAIAHVLS